MPSLHSQNRPYHKLMVLEDCNVPLNYRSSGCFQSSITAHEVLSYKRVYRFFVVNENLFVPKKMVFVAKVKRIISLCGPLVLR